MTMGILLDNDVSKEACTATVQAFLWNRKLLIMWCYATKNCFSNSCKAKRRFCFCMPFAYLFAFFLAALAGAVTRRLDFLSLER